MKTAEVVLDTSIIPPVAQGLVREFPANLGAELLTRSIMAKLFPGSHHYEGRETLPSELQPFYRVVCDTPEQASFVNLIKPPGAQVEIVLPQTEHEESNQAHPFARKLRTAEGVLIRAVTTIYGTLLLEAAVVHASIPTVSAHDHAAQTAAVGLGLLVANAVLTVIDGLDRPRGISSSRK